MKKSKSEWVASGKKHKRSYFFYQNKVFDLTQFSSIHPGGKMVLAKYIYQDITNILFTLYAHNKQYTLKTLFQYQIGTIGKQITRQSFRGKNKKIEYNNENKKITIQKKQILKSQVAVISELNLFKLMQQKIMIKNQKKRNSQNSRYLNEGQFQKYQAKSFELLQIQQQEDSIVNQSLPTASFINETKLILKSKQSLYNNQAEQLDQEKQQFVFPIFKVRQIN